MIQTETSLRVRYGESDKMNYSYYGNYALYYEVGRTEMMRELGMSYRKLEDNGIMLPVLDLHVHYIKPAPYDELLTIKTYIKEKPTVKIKFEYEIFNEQNELINKGYTTLVFVDMKKNKPVRAPQIFMSLIQQYFD